MNDQINAYPWVQQCFTLGTLLYEHPVDTFKFQLDETLALDRPRIAPVGCHQYFTDPMGTLVSFNFDENNQRMSKYDVNLRYTMCIDPPSKCQV